MKNSGSIDLTVPLKNVKCSSSVPLLLVVLDFNGVFVKKVYCPPGKTRPETEGRLTEYFDAHNMRFFTHPSIDDFLLKLKQRGYHIAIWSNTTSKYVYDVLDKLYPKDKHPNLFDFVWCRQKSVPYPLEGKEWHTIKPLSKLFEDIKVNPDGIWNKDNTWFIDDDESTMVGNKNFIIYDIQSDPNMDFADVLQRLDDEVNFLKKDEEKEEEKKERKKKERDEDSSSDSETEGRVDSEVKRSENDVPELVDVDVNKDRYKNLTESGIPLINNGISQGDYIIGKINIGDKFGGRAAQMMTVGKIIEGVDVPYDVVSDKKQTESLEDVMKEIGEINFD